MLRHMPELPPRYEWNSLSDDHKLRSLYEAVKRLEEMIGQIHTHLNHEVEDLGRRISSLEEES